MGGRIEGQPLICYEDLSIPSFQVIVVEANMGCKSCRERVFRLMSKITGVKEFTVDIARKQVVVKGWCRIPVENRLNSKRIQLCSAIEDGVEDGLIVSSFA